MNVFELFATLGLDTSGYDEGLEGAQSAGESFASSLSNGLGTACRVGAIAVTATATAVAGASVAFVSGVSDVASYADNIDKMSQKMNMSAEAYQEWDFIMQHAGTSIDSMQASIRTLSSAVESGSDAFEQLGMSQEEVASMSGEELFSATIEALQGVEDETQRTYLAGQLLGRGATELGALLNMSSEEVDAMRQEVHDLGGVMSDEAVSAGAGFQDSLQNMQTALAGVKNNLLADFLPSFSTVMDGLSAIFSGDEGGLALVTQGVNDMAEQMNETLPMFLEIGGQILTVLGNAIVENLPVIIQTGSVVIGQLASGLISNLPALMSSGLMIIRQIVSGLISSAPQIGQAGLQIISELGSTLIADLPVLISTATEMITELVRMLTDPSNLDALIQGGLALLMAVSDGLLQATPELIALIPEVIANVVTALVDNAPLILDTTLQLLQALGMAILGALGSMMGMSQDEVTAGITAIYTWVSQKFSEIASFISSTFSSITDWVSDGIEGWVNFFSDGFNSIYSTVSGILDSVLSVFTSIFDDVRGVVSSAVDFLMGAFDFEWSLPDIQLPHFSITGGVAPYGLGGQGTFPSISVDWYAKAMNQPMILNDPTIFGMGNGRMLGAGEAGAELIVGWNELKKELGGSQGVYEIHVHNYIGGDEIDEFVINSNQINDKISGGRG